MKIREVTHFLSTWVPSAYQEAYDNVGFQLGSEEDTLNGVLCTLEINEKVVEEAVRDRCNLIVTHHPLIFKGLRRITGSDSYRATGYGVFSEKDSCLCYSHKS